MDKNKLRELLSCLDAAWHAYVQSDPLWDECIVHVPQRLVQELRSYLQQEVWTPNLLVSQDLIEALQAHLEHAQQQYQEAEEHRIAYSACYEAGRVKYKLMWALFDRLQEVFDTLDPPEAAITARKLLAEGARPIALTELETTVQHALSRFLRADDPNLLLKVENRLNECLERIEWLPSLRVKVFATADQPDADSGD